MGPGAAAADSWRRPIEPRPGPGPRERRQPGRARRAPRRTGQGRGRRGPPRRSRPERRAGRRRGGQPGGGLRQARGDDPHARRGEALHRADGPQGRPRRAHAFDPHPLQRRQAGAAHRQPLAPGQPGPGRRGVRQGRLHPGVPGHPRQVRQRGRLRHDPPAPRPAEPHRHRRHHRRLGHGGLAVQARAGVQRAGGDAGLLLRGLDGGHGPARPAPDAEGGGPREPHGRRLEGRRLVPLRRLPQPQPGLHHRADHQARRGRPRGARDIRRLHRVPPRRVGGGLRPGPRRAGLPLAPAHGGPPGIRRLLARPGAGPPDRDAPLQGPHHVGAGPVGPGGHVGRHPQLDRAEGPRLPGQQLPGHGTLAAQRSQL